MVMDLPGKAIGNRECLGRQVTLPQGSQTFLPEHHKDKPFSWSYCLAQITEAFLSRTGTHLGKVIAR